MQLPLNELHAYCSDIRIESRDFGIVPLTMWQTQRYWLREVARGLEEDVHDFTTLKGCRQAGISTISLALGSWWCQKFDGTQGMTVTESQPNRAYFRDLIRQMSRSAPPDYRRAVRQGADNEFQLAWEWTRDGDYLGSRMMFEHAEKRGGIKGSLGRSRGLNYLHGTEMGSWSDQGAIGALRASVSKVYPRRLSNWEGTARGYGVFHTLWKTAQTAVSQRAIFIGSWLHELYRIKREQRALWREYGERPPHGDEAAKLAEVKRRYDYDVPGEYIAWRRWQLAEEMHGDEAMLDQEFGMLPEDCFQAFGTSFISRKAASRLRREVEDAPAPNGYEFEWGATFDELGEETIRPCEPAQADLVVWEEPDAAGVYVIGAHPAFSSSPEAVTNVIGVFRAYPDRLVQVAEYASDDEPTYCFNWDCIALCAAYNCLTPPYFILDLAGPGNAVLEEMQRLQQLGWGLSTQFRTDNPRVRDFLGNVRVFLYRRPDSFTRSAALHWKTSPHMRPWLLNSYKDSIERGALTMRSGGLLDTTTALRRGAGDENNDSIAGSGDHADDSRVMAAALANKHWLEFALPDVVHLLAPKDSPADVPRNGTEMVIREFFRSRLSQVGKRR